MYFFAIVLKVVMLNLAWKLKAEQMGFFTLNEWVRGMTELQYEFLNFTFLMLIISSALYETNALDWVYSKCVHYMYTFIHSAKFVIFTGVYTLL